MNYHVQPNPPSSDEREAAARELFKKVRLRPPYLRNAQKTLRTVREAGRKTQGQPQPIVPIIGPSQSGKTTIITDFCERIVAKEGVRDGIHPVLRVTLTSNSTVKSLALDIINAFGTDALPHESVSKLAGKRGSNRRDGTMSEILHVAATLLRNAQVEMLVIDEMHHLKNLDSDKTKWSVTEAVKWLSIEGVCPIVCMGIRRLTNVMSAQVNPQFALRCTDPIWLEPVDFEIESEKVDFMGFIDGIDEGLVSLGIFASRSNFLQEGWPERFYDFSLGILGRASRLIEAAMIVAIRAGHDRIELEDLSAATATWGIRMGLTTVNPWPLGLSQLRDRKEIRELAAKAQ